MRLLQLRRGKTVAPAKVILPADIRESDYCPVERQTWAPRAIWDRLSEAERVASMREILREAQS